MIIIDGLNAYIRCFSTAKLYKDVEKTTFENFILILTSLNKIHAKKIILWEHPNYLEKRKYVPTYKLNRKPYSDNALLGDIKQFCALSGIDQYEWVEKEADELAAYLAFQKPLEKLFFYSTDKDWLQLCDNINHIVLRPSSFVKIKMNFGSSQIYDQKRFFNEYHFMPYKLALFKTLTSDSDNTKGIPGLLKEYALKIVLNSDSVETALKSILYSSKQVQYILENTTLIHNTYALINLLRDYSEVKDNEISYIKGELQQKAALAILNKYGIFSWSNF